VHETHPTNRYVAVVDDDESVRRSFSRLLRASGFQPIAYHSAESFLEDHKQPTFECLVVDVQLTGISGLELCQKWASDRNHAPVIVITAFDNEATRREAKEAGSVDYFNKSAPGQKVIESIQRLSRINELQSLERNQNSNTSQTDTAVEKSSGAPSST
jgi:FixJ family two-component response regulator